jgi:DNA (cytosine-5)-methyltransferase 1
MPLKVLDLFSGIGGFSLGLESTGYFETVAFCEKDEFCKKVLQKHWSQLKIYDDVRSLHDTKIQADVVTGGFPCQSFSQAGLQKGRTDDRWLWNEMFDVIKQVRPRWVIGENVQGIINIEEGMVLRQVQNDLEGEGFKVQCFIIPASGIGAWHNRNRVWILACNISDTNSIRHRRGNSTRCANEEWTFLPREQEGGKMGSKTERRSNVSDTDKQRTQVQAEGKQSSIKLSGSKSKETWWQTESKICRIPDGVSYGVDRDRAKRIKALGNSIVPQIARQIGLAIMEAENDN